jgi:transglutaminase-like putative cysteine protease
MNYEISHVTRITYETPVRLARFNIRLEPASWRHQTIANYTLIVDPLPWTRTDEPGPYIVNESKLLVRSAITQLQVESRFSVTVEPSGIDYATVAAPTVAEVRGLALALPGLTALSPASYLFGSPTAPLEPEIAAWAANVIEDEMTIVEAGRALMYAIHAQFRYDSGATVSDTPPRVAFRQRRGVCQDFAHIMIVAARAFGLPAAYVSGYLRTLPPPGKPRLVGADASHAWLAVFAPGAGWVPLDPTNDVVPGEQHVTVAWGRDYSDVTPVRGVIMGGGRHDLWVSVDVSPGHADAWEMTQPGR